MRTALLCFLLMTGGCLVRDESGNADAQSTDDAGISSDAGESIDAGGSRDAGDAGDAGDSIDAGDAGTAESCGPLPANCVQDCLGPTPCGTPGTNVCCYCDQGVWGLSHYDCRDAGPPPDAGSACGPMPSGCQISCEVISGCLGSSFTDECRQYCAVTCCECADDPPHWFTSHLDCAPALDGGWVPPP